MKYQNINSIRMKEINSRILLNNIRKYGPISRKDLMQYVGLTTGTITNITDELLKKGFILETGTGESAGGRKPIMLEINPNAGYVLGVELNTTRISCVLTDFKPNILMQETIDIDLKEGKERTIDQIISFIEEIMDKHSIEREKVYGIGFISAGPYDHENGVILNPPNFSGWKNVPITGIIQERTGITTYLERDTAATGMAEYWFGKIDSPKCILGISLFDTGVGGGLIIDGKIFRGYMDAACEIGHIQMEKEGLCACGNIGCLELVSNGQAALRYVKEDISAGKDTVLKNVKELTVSDAIQAAEKDDMVSKNAIIKCAEYIGTAISNLLNTISPNIVIIGGDFALESNVLFENIKKKVRERDYPKSKESIDIRRTDFGIYSCAIGGVAVVFERLSRV